MSKIRWGTLCGAVVVTSLLIALPAGPASAAKPDVDRSPADTDSIVSEDCGFEIQQDVTFTQGVTLTLYDRNGDVRELHVVGSFHGTLTNVETGDSIQLNFSGPGRIDPDTFDLSGTGPWLIGGPDDPTTTENEGFLVFVRGQVVATTDSETGVVTIESTTGQVTDICAALA